MEGKRTEAFQLSEVVGSSQSKTRRQRRCLLDSQWRMRLEFTILVVMIVIVWGLFSLPIVFYYDSSSKEQTERENITNSLNETDRDFGNMSGECYHKYTGSHCMTVLKAYADCESPGRITTDVHVSNALMDQKAVENVIDNIMFALDLYINPSDECRKAVIPLLCLYYFGLCGTYNTDYRPTAAECREVRDSTCQSEWKTAEKLLELSAEQFMLPDCSGLNDEGLECNEVFTFIETNCTIVCHEHFYCGNNFCKPRCDRFTIYSDEYVKLSDGLMITSGCVGLLCGIAVVVVFCIRRKKLMIFPTILVLYMTIFILIVECIILVSFMDRPKLFCGSPDLAESLRSSTDFCKFNGIIQTYAIIHLAMWWIFNICAIFWKVQFPFHSRYYDQTNQTRYVHIACVVAAIILPVYAPLAIALKGGFVITRFPPTGCLGRDVDAIFYTVIAPITVILSIGTTLLLLILWRIRKHMSSHRSKNKVLLSPAERKVLVVFLYYLFFGVLQLSTFSLSIKDIDQRIRAIGNYFQCQRSGIDQSCSLNAKFINYWSLASFIVLLLLPVINLYFAIKLRSVYFLCNFCKKYRLAQFHSNTASTSVSS